MNRFECVFVFVIVCFDFFFRRMMNQKPANEIHIFIFKRFYNNALKIQTRNEVYCLILLTISNHIYSYQFKSDFRVLIAQKCPLISHEHVK